MVGATSNSFQTTEILTSFKCCHREWYRIKVKKEKKMVVVGPNIVYILYSPSEYVLVYML